jgi:hypothetical protein
MLDTKLIEYRRETNAMPFLDRLMGPERVAMFSFIHSVATSLGTSIYEQMSKICAEPSSQKVLNHIQIGGTLNDAQNAKISDILNELRSGKRKPDKVTETKEILQIDPRGGKEVKRNAIVDFYMVRNGEEYFFELKTVKPNIGNFAEIKEKLLQWIARKQSSVNTMLAFPYNPYEPRPYRRFTQQNMIDEVNELLVGRDYWDFLSGKGTYDELLKIFNDVGQEFEIKISEKIGTLKEKRE